MAKMTVQSSEPVNAMVVIEVTAEPNDRAVKQMARNNITEIDEADIWRDCNITVQILKRNSVSKPMAHFKASYGSFNEFVKSGKLVELIMKCLES